MRFDRILSSYDSCQIRLIVLNVLLFLRPKLSLETSVWKVSRLTITKGQIMSQCIYEIINFPKYHRKDFIDFCPGRFYRLGTCDLFSLFSRPLYSGECITYLVWITFQGRNLSNSFCGILENRWFHKYFVWPLAFFILL